MDFPIIETERLKLIEIQEKHVDILFSIFSLEDVTRYYGMSPFNKREQSVNLVKSFAKNFQDKRAIRWGIILRNTGEFVGTIGLNNLQLLCKRAEVGYELHPIYWKQGIITEALSSVINYSFNELGLFRLGALTYQENESSYKILLKLGFQKEGVLRGYIYQDGNSHDALLFSILKPDWSHCSLTYPLSFNSL